MKRRFTIVAATLALLAIFIAPLGMMGQNSANGGEMTRSSIVLNKDNITNINGGSGYAAYDGDHTIGDVTTVTTSNVMINSQKLQFKKSGSYLYNKTAMPGNITKITLSDNVSLTIYVGTSSNPNTTTVSSGTAITDSFTYFAVKNATSGALLTTSITVEYSEGGDTPELETYTVTYKPNGPDASDIEDTYTEGTDVTLRPANTFSYQGYTFSEWNTDESGEGDSYEAGGMIEGIDDDLILFAQWTELAPGDDHTLTFDFEDETAHRTSGSNSYGTNEYEENGANIILTYADAVGSGSPLSGSYHVLGRVAKNTTNSPVVLIGPIDITNWNITKIEYLTKGVEAMSQVFETSLDGSQWTNQLTLGNMPTSVTTETVDDLSITGTELYLRWTVSVASSTGSNRDFNLDDIVITYTESDTPTPSIAAENVALDYDATSGRIVYTINNVPDPAGTLSAATTADWITLPNNFASPIAFTCTANENTTARTATVTLTYTYNTDQTVTANVTVTQAAAPLIYSTIPALFAAATSTETNVLVTFNNWVVSGVSTNGKNVFVTDNNGNGFVIFDNNGGLGNTYTAGDILAGTSVSCKLKKYNGFAELLNVNATDLTITAGGTVTVANVAMADLAGVNTGALVSYQNLTCSIDNNKYYLSDGNNNTLQVYNAIYAFEALEAGKTYNITGVYQQYNSTKEILPRSAADIEEFVPTVPTVTVANATVNVPAEGAEGTLTVTYENFTEIVADVYFCDAEGEAATYEWITAEINTDLNVDYLIEENEGEARTAYFTVNALNGDDLVESNLVAINQAAYVAPVTGSKYVKVTSSDELIEGQYLIVYEEAGLAFDGSLKTLDAEGNTISVTINNDEIEVTNETAALEFTIAAITDGYSIQSASGYYIGQTSNANGLHSSDETAYLNTISFTDDGDANIVSSSAYLRYNSASNQARFRYYKSSSYTGQKAIQLYKKVEEAPATETYTLEIAGYVQGNGGYHLIASPVGSDVTPSAENGFIADVAQNYDLYWLDQTQVGEEWQNYKAGEFDLVSGMGYLYASKEGTTLTFEGTPYDGDGSVSLVKDDDAVFSGWNLIGNPFSTEATIDKDFYRMNETGSAIVVADEDELVVDAMEGIFVIAEEDGESATFTPVSGGEPTPEGFQSLVLNVVRNRAGVIDRAIVRFGEGRMLPKFQLNPNNTKIYITEGNQDYAIVYSNNDAEIPVSFKAAERGTYTISINVQNVDMNYLHLYDKLTENDVDLLQTSSYTFEATPADNASRFTLVFSANSVNENTMTFAFFNGSEWVISNQGDATLQVIDVMGRVLSSKTINGNAELSLNEVPGVYMFRLVNGNNVKVQKVVVR